MVEKDFYPLFKKKLETLQFVNTAVFELKMVKGNRFAINTVHPHQIEGLLNATQGVYLRIADQPFVTGGFQQKKAFDCMWINGADAYVVPVFYVPRKKKNAYLIPIKEFLKFENKSVTEEELSGFVCIEL